VGKTRFPDDQSQLDDVRCQLTSLGIHSVLICDIRRSTFSAPHAGHGGLGFSGVERSSSKRVLQASQRYS
jgi:hypothetical protein